MLDYKQDRKIPFTLGDRMKKVTVYWSETMHFMGELDVPDGLDKEEEYDWVSTNLPFDVAQDIDSELEEGSIVIQEDK